MSTQWSVENVILRAFSRSLECLRNKNPAPYISDSNNNEQPKQESAAQKESKQQLHKILLVAVSSVLGLRVERRHHLQSVYLKDVVFVDRTDENRLG
ncbi:hypothetical protein AVEN_114697-1 [Araneus ventricosus]|uniref:Uncharacterized protein n=1 Tax=Araneus ventricosus TaxID=182803 RepID=A0A4Y2U002_ARAVE|nr:hypothetical protein AVEN_114697-1 [Araneus ventricosus]